MGVIKMGALDLIKERQDKSAFYYPFSGFGLTAGARNKFPVMVFSDLKYRYKNRDIDPPEDAYPYLERPVLSKLDSCSELIKNLEFDKESSDNDFEVWKNSEQLVVFYHENDDLHEVNSIFSGILKPSVMLLAAGPGYGNNPYAFQPTLFERFLDKEMIVIGANENVREV